MPSGPRVIGKDELASTAAGQKLQSDELQKQAKKAGGALLAVAIIQTIITGVLIAVMQNATRGPLMINGTAIAIMGVIAAAFWGLWAWSRVSPLPAVIVGLVLYATLTIADYVVLFMSMKDLPPGQEIKFNIPWLKILIIAILIQGIQAGAKHRKLMSQQPRY